MMRIRWCAHLVGHLLMRNWKTWSTSLIRFDISHIYNCAIVMDTKMPENWTLLILILWGWYQIACLLQPQNDVLVFCQLMTLGKKSDCERNSGWWWWHQFQRICLVDDKVELPFHGHKGSHPLTDQMICHKLRVVFDQNQICKKKEILTFSLKISKMKVGRVGVKGCSENLQKFTRYMRGWLPKVSCIMHKTSDIYLQSGSPLN